MFEFTSSSILRFAPSYESMQPILGYKADAEMTGKGLSKFFSLAHLKKRTKMIDGIQHVLRHSC